MVSEVRISRLRAGAAMVAHGRAAAGAAGAAMVANGRAAAVAARGGGTDFRIPVSGVSVVALVKTDSARRVSIRRTAATMVADMAAGKGHAAGEGQTDCRTNEKKAGHGELPG